MTTLALTVADRPALGAYLGTDEVVARRDRARWMSEMSQIDYAARSLAMHQHIAIFDGLRTGRRLDLIADDLRTLAGQIDDVPQLLIGGWPIYPWLIRAAA